MRLPFRDHHLLAMLEEYDLTRGPLDRWIHLYFRAHPALGSKDRAFIAEIAYALMRWKGLLGHFCLSGNFSWREALALLRTLDKETLAHDPNLSAHVRCSFPEALFKRLVADYGESTALEWCLWSNQPAPATIRANPLKISRDQLLARLSAHYAVRPCRTSPLGITFEKKTAFFSMEEYRNGLFEVQDEASQLVGLRVEAKPGDKVLDYCAGSGGKTLAFAHRLQGKGQIFLHDIRSTALQEARKRLNRAGLQNVQFLPAEAAALRHLQQRMDWVVVDAPCSGTGTLRRNPDMKWRLDPQAIERLVQEQRAILAQALPYLKPQGRLLYATCSVLKAENQEQIAYFCAEHQLAVEGEVFQSNFKTDEMDGLFAAVLCRKEALLRKDAN